MIKINYIIFILFLLISMVSCKNSREEFYMNINSNIYNKDKEVRGDNLFDISVKRGKSKVLEYRYYYDDKNVIDEEYWIKILIESNDLLKKDTLIIPNERVKVLGFLDDHIGRIEISDFQGEFILKELKSDQFKLYFLSNFSVNIKYNDSIIKRKILIKKGQLKKGSIIYK